MSKTYEMCPHCEQEVELINKFQLLTCPNCKTVIMPCSICKDRKCDKCPLETNEYRERLVADVFNLCYKDDSLDNRDTNIAYLNTLTNMELSIKLSEQLIDNDGYISFGDDDDE